VSRDIEHLVQRVDRVRDLARALVRDAATADDVVQDALVAALGREGGPPREPSWLRRAVRSLAADRARGERGRRWREEAAARDERLGDAAESVARVELSRDVAAAVVSLEEPSRSAITMRFVDGLPPREIARRTGASVPTVKKRIERGLAQLRVKLEGRHGAGGAWAVALLPLTGRDVLPTAAVASVGASAAPALVLTSTTGALAGLLLLLGCGTVAAMVLLGGDRASDPATGRSRAEASADAGGAPLGLDRVAAGVRSEASSRTLEPGGGVPAPAVSTEAAAGGGGSELRFVDLEGRPLPGLDVRWSVPDGIAPHLDAAQAVPREITTDPDGVLIRPPYPHEVMDTVRQDLLPLGMVRGDGGVEMVVVAPTVDLAGRCVYPEGTPVEGATVGSVASTGSLHSELARADGVATLRRDTKTGPDGSFTLSRVPTHATFPLHVTRQGETHRTYFELPQQDDSALVLEVDFPIEREIPWHVFGRVVDGAGEGVRGVEVLFGRTTAATDAEGHFEFDVERGQWFDGCPLVAKHPSGAFAAGPVPDQADAASMDGAGPYEVTLHASMPGLVGVVVDGEGAPVEGIEVHLVDGTADGASTRILEGAARRGIGLCAVSGPDGSFEYERVDRRTYRVLLLDPETFAAKEAVVEPGPGSIELVFDPVTAPVRGRLVDAFGAPAEGVEVAPRVVTYRSRDGSHFTPRSGKPVVTGTDGVFELTGVTSPPVGLSLRQVGLPGGGHLLDVGPDELDSELEITVTLFCEVELDHGPASRFDCVRFSDGSGTSARVRQGFVDASTDGFFKVRPRPGAGFGRVFVHQTATQIELFDGRKSLGRSPIRLAPGRVNRLDP